MSVCPTCGQSLPEKLPLDLQLHLSAVQKIILRAVHRAGEHGILSDLLFDEIYNGTINGGPATGRKALHMHIHYLNRKLEPYGFVIRAAKGGGHQPNPYILTRIEHASEMP